MQNFTRNINTLTNAKEISRAITLIANGETLPLPQSNTQAHVVGITGPPGAGKSTLTDRLIGELAAKK